VQQLPLVKAAEGLGWQRREYPAFLTVTITGPDGDEEPVPEKTGNLVEQIIRGVIMWESMGDFIPEGATPVLEVPCRRSRESNDRR